MRLGEFKLRYQVLQREDGSPSRIIFWDLPRDLFDLIPLQSRTIDYEGQGQTSYIKSMQKLKCEWWFWTNEDKDGNPDGVLPPEELPRLPERASIVCPGCGELKVEELIHCTNCGTYLPRRDS